MVAFIVLLVSFFYETANAYPVPELPEDNLIVNPWFRSLSDPTDAGFDGWIRPLNEGVTWGPSQKESNPSPDIVISGTCGFEQVYCGTAARWAEQFGVLYPYVDVYAYQVVAADPSHRKLKFFTYYVSHIVEVGEVNIYGGASPEGPWELVWVPLYHTEDELIVPESGEIRDLWMETGFLEWNSEQGYPYYKIELHSRLPESPIPDGIKGVGFKLTGVYFSTAFTDEPGEPSPTPGLSSPPTSTTIATAVVTDTASATSTTTLANPTPASTSVAEVDTEPDIQEVTTLTAEAVSPTEIILVWNESQNNRRGLRLERSLNIAAGWEPVAALESGVFEYTDNGLPPDTVHYYRLRASQEEISNIVSVRTLSLPEPTLVPPTEDDSNINEGTPEENVEVSPGSESDVTSAPDNSEQPGVTTPSGQNSLTILALASAALIIGIGLGVVLTRRRT